MSLLGSSPLSQQPPACVVTTILQSERAWQADRQSVAEGEAGKRGRVSVGWGVGLVGVDVGGKVA